MAEVMRACFLRAGLSRCRDASAFVLGNPKAWLGTAYHEVLERIAGARIDPTTIDADVERLWDAAVSVQHARAVAHGLESRFGAPVTWPGYYLARAAVRLRAGELIRLGESASPAPAVSGVQGEPHPAGEIREQEFTGCGGKLLGRPDVIRRDEIVDYKSGVLVEFDEATQSDVVKAAYVRQLRIYGYLVHQALGRWLSRGVLLPLAGAGVGVALSPAECEREAAEAVALLDEYNARLKAGRPVEDLAAATPINCKWCPFKLICPAFWHTVTPSWSGQLEGAAIEGILAAPARAIFGGAALGISVDVVAGTETTRSAEIAPLNPTIHATAATLVAGDRIRLVGLRVRQDGTLLPTARTVLARVADLPAVEIKSQEVA